MRVKTGKTINCKTCGTSFYAPRWRLVRNLKYCSYKCYWKVKHDEPWNKNTKGVMKLNGGSFKKGNPTWLGELPYYKHLHYWVNKTNGKPKVCEHCGITENITWANKSHKYYKKPDDWLSLCVRCHRIYDKQSYARIQGNFLEG